MGSCANMEKNIPTFAGNLRIRSASRRRSNRLVYFSCSMASSAVSPQLTSPTQSSHVFLPLFTGHNALTVADDFKSSLKSELVSNRQEPAMIVTPNRPFQLACSLCCTRQVSDPILSVQLTQVNCAR